MQPDASNLALLERWRQGDEFAAQILVDRYMARLTALARARLSRKLARRLDPEDVVMSAWRSFFVATRGGRIAVPTGDDLWPLLVTLTLRKLRRQVARQSADKRSIDDETPIDVPVAWMEAVSRDPTPDDAALLADQLESLLQSLSPADRDVVVQRLQGWSNAEIAHKLNVSERTIRRVLANAREQFEAGDAFPHKPHDTMRSVTPGESLMPEPLADKAAGEIPHIDERDILLQKLIGAGGFGKVYRAVLRHSRQTVAVKFLSKKFWRHRAAVESFRSEIRLLSRLRHQQIIRVFGDGQTVAGAPFFVMEHIEGVSLANVSLSASSSISDIIRIVREVVRAVGAAHAHGIIHGDLTPSNILLEAVSGRVVLTDFGFSRVMHSQRITLLGGTPGYLAPEQVSDAFGDVTPRTDVYGIGGILYTLLTGAPPFTGETQPDVIANVLSSRRPIAPTVIRRAIPLELEKLALACLEKEPADRPESVDVASRLDEIGRDALER